KTASGGTSGDQIGDPARGALGEIHVIGVTLSWSMPISECVPRFDTNAMRLPSGANSMLPFTPRAKNSCFAGAEPSIGTVQIWRFRSKRTASPDGAITGPSPPSVSTRGAPPSNGTDHNSIFGGTGIDAAFTADKPQVSWSQFASSPPRR